MRGGSSEEVAEGRSAVPSISRHNVARRRPPAVLAGVGAALASLLAAGTLLASGGSSAAGGQTTPAVTPSNWTVYHGEASGAGRATSPTALAPLHTAWNSSTLDGQIFGEPLVFGGRVYVATENDSVYALSARTGLVLWRTHLATPVPSGELPCGDISPTVGITGTPVIDPGRNEIFVVADEQFNGAPRHVLYGIDTTSGRVDLHQRVDPPTSSGDLPAAELQRTGLNLTDNRVIFGYGGNAGDCSTYNGWVMGVPEAGGPARTFEVDPAPGERQGAVWMGGAAPEVDAQGNVWLATGNGSVTSSSGPYDRSDAVTELSPQLSLLQFFAPQAWWADNAGDRDLGSSAPALLSGGAVVQAGKSGTGYLLSASGLGGVGHQLATVSACGGVVDGGTAVSKQTAYLPCQGGVVRVDAALQPPALHVVWQASSGVPGPPLIGGSRLFSIGSGQLHVLKTGTGQQVGSFALGAEANHFPTPTLADGLVLAASANQVHAFDGPDGLPPSPAG